jgi:suppressor of fused
MPRLGWDAVAAHFATRYPNSEALSFRSLIQAEVDPEPCKQVDAFPAGDHWHLVGFGLTELFAKVSDIPDQNGWGYELTLRVPREPSDSGPPRWAAGTIRDLMRYVERSKQSVSEGDWFGYPDGFVPGTNIAAAVFTRDPSFPEMLSSPFGRFSFRQVVGITEAELEFHKANGSAALLKRLRAADPSLVTRPGRASVVGSQVVQAAMPMVEPAVSSSPAARGDISSMQLRVLRRSRAFDGNTELEIGRNDAPLLAEALEQRLASGRPVAVCGESTRIELRATQKSSIDLASDPLVIALSRDAALQLAASLRAGTPDGAHLVDDAPGVQFRVVWQ